MKAGYCIPWDYTTPIDGAKNWNTFDMCFSNTGDYDFYGQKNGLALFEKAMNSNEPLKDCNCLPNCEETAFETQVQNK